MLLNDEMPRDEAERIAKLLTEGKWTHYYPITSDKAKTLSLPVKDEIPIDV